MFPLPKNLSEKTSSLLQVSRRARVKDATANATDNRTTQNLLQLRDAIANVTDNQTAQVLLQLRDVVF